jgi:hypothetical protein
MDVEDQMVHNYPSCRKTMKLTVKLMLFLLHMATYISIFFKKMHHEPKSEGQGQCFQGLHTCLCLENDGGGRRRRRER